MSPLSFSSLLLVARDLSISSRSGLMTLVLCLSMVEMTYFLTCQYILLYFMRLWIELNSSLLLSSSIFKHNITSFKYSSLHQGRRRETF